MHRQSNACQRYLTRDVRKQKRTYMSIDSREIKLRVLLQDFEALQDSLGVSFFRRASADLIDGCVMFLLAFGLSIVYVSPWLALVYLPFRDISPSGGSIGKRVMGLRIYAFPGYSKSTKKQLAVRGGANCLVIIPGVLLTFTFMVFMAVGFGAIGFVCFVFLIWRDNSTSWLLRMLGYDVYTGRTFADWIAGTYIVFPRDVEALSSMEARIARLRSDIAGSDPVQDVVEQNGADI